MATTLNNKMKKDAPTARHLRQWVIRLLMLGLGLGGSLFFGLATLGFLVSGSLPEGLPAGMISIALLGGSVWLVCRGWRELRRPEREQSPPPQAVPPDDRWDEDIPAVACPNCGASGVPDEKGCCEYCGGALNAER